MRIVFGICGIGAIAATVLCAWLIWPLPTNQFDWQAQFASFADHGQCREATEIAARVYGLWQSGDALDRLGRMSRNEYCPNGDAFVRPDTMERFEQEPRLSFLGAAEKIGSWNSIGEDLWRWRRIRMTRASAFGSLLNATDLTVVFRCSRLARDEFEWEWRTLRNDLAQIHSAPGRLTAWDRREAECAVRIADELERLGSANEEISDAHFALIVEYENLAERFAD